MWIRKHTWKSLKCESARFEELWRRDYLRFVVTQAQHLTALKSLREANRGIARLVKKVKRLKAKVETKYKPEIKYSAGYALLNPNNCAVIEYTADGARVGPCTFYLKDGVTCPRHGTVKAIEPTE